jgi:hypothetical protein
MFLFFQKTKADAPFAQTFYRDAILKKKSCPIWANSLLVEDYFILPYKITLF